MAEQMIALHPSLRRLRPSQHDWNDILKSRHALTPQIFLPRLHRTNPPRGETTTWKEKILLPAVNARITLAERNESN